MRSRNVSLVNVQRLAQRRRFWPSAAAALLGRFLSPASASRQLVPARHNSSINFGKLNRLAPASAKLPKLNQLQLTRAEPALTCFAKLRLLSRLYPAITFGNPENVHPAGNRCGTGGFRTFGVFLRALRFSLCVLCAEAFPEFASIRASIGCDPRAMVLIFSVFSGGMA